MPATYEKIATTTLSSAASNITFSSIPATYTDLRIVWVFQPVSSGNLPALQYNGDTATNYSYLTLFGNGTTATSQKSSNNTLAYLNSSTTVLSQWLMQTIDIFSYAGSTNKTLLSTYSGDANGSGLVSTSVNLWRSTSAITSVKLFLDAGSNLVSGTTATLYGILKA